MKRLPLLVIAFGLLGCGPRIEPIVACADVAAIHPICGFQNPEDLALLADGRTVVVSQFASMDGSEPGSLALFDLESERLRIAYRGGDPAEHRAGWGDEACPGPPAQSFAPHGIDLARRLDGALRLLVVNHGGRESIEVFEVTGTGDAARIEWRGCAVAPEIAFLNDVVALPDGGFLTTHMMDRDRQMLDIVRASLGLDTGFVYEWQRGEGFSAVAGTEGPFPNGIEVSNDGRDIYLNLYIGGEVRRISRRTGELLASAEVAQPDNSTWGLGGRLLVASHKGGFREQMACMGLEQGACPLAFEIVALDPETLTGSAVFAHSGAPMGAATVALDIGHELLMGSFKGDRVIRARPTTTGDEVGR